MSQCHYCHADPCECGRVKLARDHRHAMATAKRNLEKFRGAKADAERLEARVDALEVERAEFFQRWKTAQTVADNFCAELRRLRERPLWYVLEELAARVEAGADLDELAPALVEDGISPRLADQITVHIGRRVRRRQQDRGGNPGEETEDGQG